MNNITLNNRLNSVKDTVNEKKLKRYALDDPSEQVREIAVSKIKDPIVLSHIVQNEKSVNVAKKAIQNIDDEYELKSLFIVMSKSGAKYDKEIYLEIINKVTDRGYLIEMINVNFFNELFEKINVKNHKISISLKKYNRECYPSKRTIYAHFYNQNKLKKIALDKKFYYYRQLAIQHITDNDFLVKIASTDLSYEVRREATKHIKNQDILVKIALTDLNYGVRKEATKHIKNQDILVKIASTDLSCEVRREAIKHIINQDILVKIASTDLAYEVRREATKHLKKQDILVKIVSTDLDEDDQIEALKRIKNHEILLDLLLNKSSYVVSKLVNRIDDQPSLLEIALSNKETKENLNEETKILYDALKKEVG